MNDSLVTMDWPVFTGIIFDVSRLNLLIGVAA
jgi:hypothetical protein